MVKILYGVLLVVFGVQLSVGQDLRGVVVDQKTGDPIIGANVVIKGSTNGVTTDYDGNFSFEAKDLSFPLTLQVSFIGYKTIDREVSSSKNSLQISIQEDKEMLQEVSVVEQRLSNKQKESALTVEAMDALAIKETPSVSFYEGLGNLKGVDLTSASIGFKIINTRGFNSTSPVRSLQIIDGVDNQAPGLNFSLGNFLGASELDVLNVDIIAGASSAFYGPNAFNGVIAMTTKSPFDYTGLSASVKVGERAMTEYAVRWAQKFQNKEGRDVFAYKLNVFYLTADDWEADNLDATFGSEDPRGNPGGYDAINRYGDETQFDDGSDRLTYPGIGNYHQNGIEEIHLVDYNTENLKLSTALHWRPTEDLEVQYSLNYGFGTTVYQGDNRYSLKNIQFLQNKIQVGKEDKWFVRAYSTNENAGDSYDAYFTALQMQNVFVDEGLWGSNYRGLWSALHAQSVRDLPGYPSDPDLTPEEFYAQMDVLIADNPEFFNNAHADVKDRLQQAYGGEALTPGTALYDSLFNDITGKSFNEGGSRFFDESALYHLQGQYQFDEYDWGKLTVGANGRLYLPNSQGTLFSDTAGERITNSEFGSFIGLERGFYDNRLKAGLTVRFDKNQNFDLLSSQALSFVYSLDDLNTLRFSVSSAIRNPTLQDQYLFYNVGRAILLGNLEGIDSLVTQGDVENFLGAGIEERRDYEWDYYSIDPVRPERVQTAEVGYRTTLWNALYLDLNYYYSWYQDFIGFNIGLEIEDDPSAGPDNRFSGAQAYRVAANASDQVTTQGFSLGANYYFWDYYTLSGNYTWNILNTATDDPIIPAFNTPEHKYNISFGGRNLKIGSTKDWAFNVTYKWIEGFLFEGSPQFTGFIDSYSLLDAQITKKISKSNTTIKLGASNLANNKVFQVYGGPRVGRLAYISLLYEY